MKSKVNDATMVVSPEIVSCDDTVCDPCELPAGELDDVSGAGPLLFVAAAALAVAAGAYVAKDTGSAVAGAILTTALAISLVPAAGLAPTL